MLSRLTAAMAAFLLPASALAGQAAPGTAAPDPAPVEIMVLGSFHFANPGRDMVNVTVDDMLAPRRQREIAALTASLARWQPTRIAIEAESTAPDLSLASYAESDRLLREDRGEGYQIGYRLARVMGHTAVYGFDEQPGQGEPDYFPMDKVMAYAEGHGQAPMIGGMFAEVQAMVARQQEALPGLSVAEALAEHNDPAVLGPMHDRLYYGLLAIGDGEAQPGAELNAYWYMRNAKMFAKLVRIARPGDRILVLVGSGHATWLRHFAAHAPGYRLVESLPYIEAAASAGGAGH